MATRKQLEQQYIEDRAFWGSVSSRWRGLAGGIILGGIIGAGLALVAATGFSLLSGVAFAAMGKGTLLGLTGFFAASGMLFGAHMWGTSGQMSGAVAHGLMAARELEMGGKAHELYKEFTPVENAPAPHEPKKPLFNWKVMGIGAAIAGSLAAFLAISGIFPASYMLLGQGLGTPMGAAAAAVSGGAFGTIFGIHFRPWQAFKRVSDGLFEGRVSGRTAPATDNLRDQLVAASPVTHKIEFELTGEPALKAHADKILAERLELAKNQHSLN